MTVAEIAAHLGFLLSGQPTAPALQPDPAWGEYKPKLLRYREAKGSPAWVGDEHPAYAWYLKLIVEKLQPRRILELGVQCGGSAYGILQGMPESSVYVGIDNEVDVNARSGMSDFAAQYGRPNALFITGWPAICLPLFAQPWDLVHFDHYKECYLPDLAQLKALGQLRPETVCLFHDTDGHAQHLVPEIEAQFEHSWLLPVPAGARMFAGLKLPPDPKLTPSREEVRGSLLDLLS